MHGRAILSFLLFFLSAGFAVNAQDIRGEVTDIANGNPVSDVQIGNPYTGMNMSSDIDGKFFITASKGQLLEFRKMGYKTVRVRIPQGNVPPFFKIIMQKGADIRVPEYVQGAPRRYDYTNDSLRFHDLYKHELDFPKMSAFDMIQHPFDALSRHNQEIWAFQRDYEKTEQSKYVDYTFNPELVTKITGLTGDSLQRYMLRFRPAYDQLRRMNEYNFYTYIKRTVEIYRGRDTPRGSR